MDESVVRLAQLLRGAHRAVFFGGAGVSTESGIPDFRSVDGLYNQQFDYPPEAILEHDFFYEKPEIFYDFYRKKMLFPAARPNAAHRALARLESDGHLSAVVTQNIDGLHTAAGSRTVYELHGSVHRNRCTRCGRRFDGIDAILSSEGVPRCPCGGIIKPDVVLYGEGLDDATVDGAVRAIAEADLLIIAGTSLTVWPAAGFIRYYHGRETVLINLSPTDADSLATLRVYDKVGRVLDQALTLL